MEDEAAGETFVEVPWGVEGKQVSGADIKAGGEAVADAEEAFEVDVALVVAVVRGGAGDFEVKVEPSGGGVVVSRVIGVFRGMFPK
jgi:hypothetical protein